MDKIVPMEYVLVNLVALERTAKLAVSINSSSHFMVCVKTNSFRRIYKENQINLSILMIEKDPCKPNPCKNGGTCTDGACKCATGFSGDKCQTSGQTSGKYLEP